MMQPEKFFLPEQDYKPAYLSLAVGELAERARQAIASLEKCTLCPRRCGANRIKGYVGTCSTGIQAIVSSAAPHFGEEDCLRGNQGSGTIFFSGCNLRCTFCQNFDISHRPSGKRVSAEELAEIMLSLQAIGCHNINLVTPDHVVPQILSALEIAMSRGLQLPLVFNTSAYSSVETLAMLDGIVDIYMPDYKMADTADAKLYLQAKDYPEVAHHAIREMHRQTGDLLLDEHGLAKRGVLVRHLVMPEYVGGSQAVMEALAGISTDMYINIMGQYRPAGLTDKEKYASINRPVHAREVEQVYQQAATAGLWRFDEQEAYL